MYPYDMISETNKFGMTAFMQNGKWGVLNREEKQIVPPIYEKVQLLCNGFTGAKNGNTWIILDTLGSIVLTEDCDEIYCDSECEDNTDYVLLIRGSLRGIFNTKFNISTPIKYNRVRYLTNGFVLCRTESGVGLLNEFLAETIPCVYSDIIGIGNNTVIARNSREYYLLSMEGKLIKKLSYKDISPFNNKLYYVKQNELYGLIDHNFNEIVSPIYDNIIYVNPDRLIIVKNGLYGIISNTGEILLEPVYKEVKSLKTNYYAIVNEDSLSALFDQNFNQLTEFKYAIIQPYYEGFKTIVSTDSHLKQGIVDYEGKEILAPIYDNIFEENEYYIAGKKDDNFRIKYAIFDFKGNQLTRMIYDKVRWIMYNIQNDTVIACVRIGSYEGYLPFNL